MTNKNDLTAAFFNITSPKTSEPAEAEERETATEAPSGSTMTDYSNQNGILLKKKEKEELRNVRKQFAITETLSNKLKDKSKELGISENEIIIQLLTYM